MHIGQGDLYFCKSKLTVEGNNMAMSETYRKITRGVKAGVIEGKRGVLGFVFVSKNRGTELETLKTSTFYQTMELVTDRADKNLFKMKLNSITDRDSFLDQAVQEANLVGVGTSGTVRTVGRTTSTVAKN
jgi:hypothetical protein